jgi:hypothetical protein
MTGVPGYTSAVDEFITQAQTWLGQASAAAKASATKIEAGTYTASDAASDMVQAVTLTASGWIGLVAAFYDAATEVGMPAVSMIATSDPVPITAIPAGATATMALDGPLKSGPAEIPASRVKFDPDPLGAGATSFKLVVDWSGFPALAYDGKVKVTPTSGPVQTVAVHLELP